MNSQAAVALIAELEQACVSHFLPAAALAEYRQGAISKRFLEPVAKSIQMLAMRYVEKGRGEVELDASDPGAYALYYLPVNIWKVIHVLSAVRAILPPAVSRVVDVGSGPGTALFGLLAAGIHLEKAELIVVEKSAEMRRVGRVLWSAVGAGQFAGQNAGQVSGQITPEIATQRREEDDRALTTPADLIFMCNMLSECAPSEQERLLRLAAKSISAEGMLVIIEPALIQTTQRLMALRDFVLTLDEGLNVHYPCVHRAPCPMRATDPQNWCHTNLSWEKTKLVRQLDELTGFNKHRISLSALVISRRARACVDEFVPATAISRIERNKIGFQGLVCSKPYYGDMTLSRRDRSEGNKVFQKLESWDQVEISAPLLSKISADQVVVKPRGEIKTGEQAGGDTGGPGRKGGNF